jgi:hypothetical protein
MREKFTMFDSIDPRVARTPRDLPKEEQADEAENMPAQQALLRGF